MDFETNFNGKIGCEVSRDKNINSKKSVVRVFFTIAGYEKVKTIG